MFERSAVISALIVLTLMSLGGLKYYQHLQTLGTIQVGK
jgi:hypothetical protein